MRVLVTGQVGMNKKEFLDATVDLAGQRGERIDIYHVGDRMYAEAPDVRAGRILDLPLSRLTNLRRSVFKDIINTAQNQKNIIVNTHATFRWRHGLFSAFDFDQLRQLKPDMLICLVDNIEVLHHQLHKDHTIDATLKDLMVWREEEIMATELMAQALGCPNEFYVLSRGRHQINTDTCFRLICRPQMQKVYPSFPMTHVVQMPEVLAEIDAFRAELANHFISFDPGDVDEKLLLDRALKAASGGQDFVTIAAGSISGAGKAFNVPVKQILDIAGDVDGQIYARDFKLIDQSDMIVSLVPELDHGLPGLSSGVERELQHAFEHGKEVYVVWKPQKKPSPFITETSTKWFTSTDEALNYFEKQGMCAQTNLFGD